MQSNQDKINKAIGETIRAKRISAGISQKRLAGELGITFQQLQKYETGINRIQAARLWLIAQTLGIEPQAMFGALDRSEHASAALSRAPSMLEGEIMALVQRIPHRCKSPLKAFLTSIAERDSATGE